MGLYRAWGRGWRTAPEVAGALVAEVESAMPGLDLVQGDITIDGEAAVVLDGMPGQDLSRQIVVVHGGRLYRLTFVPSDRSLGDAYEQVDEFVVDPESRHITHVTMRRGHLWGEEEISIPLSEIERIAEDVVYLKIDKRQIEALPAVKVRRVWQ